MLGVLHPTQLAMHTATRSNKKKAQKFPPKPRSSNKAIDDLRVSPEVRAILHEIQKNVDESWRETVKFLAQKLEQHGTHLESCNVYFGWGKDSYCTCGLDKLLKEKWAE